MKDLASAKRTSDQLLERYEGTKQAEVHAEQSRHLTEEIERRAKPMLKPAMRSVQAALKNAVEELNDRMKEKQIAPEHWRHFDHCTSSFGHEYHFMYEKPKDIAWDTSDIDG
jgi:predicted metallo-beta-lactamase superfamily hydrolase